ncbi:MAG: M23 family metallopeptidase [Bacillota bacterium]|jgi:murein DD-endopeptidase MepM/ murein hydrolase activator NlpD
MKKFILTAAAIITFSAVLLGQPDVIYADPESLILQMAEENDSAVAEEQEEPTDELKPLFISPMPGVVTCEFGYRKSGFHHGLDIANDWGTNIAAIAAGTVTEAGWKNSVYGYAIIIDHGNGWQSLYGHCGMLTVKAGQKVQAGDIIAIEGSTGRSTGPHLHLEIHKDGVYLNPRYFIEVSR